MKGHNRACWATEGPALIRQHGASDLGLGLLMMITHPPFLLTLSHLPIPLYVTLTQKMFKSLKNHELQLHIRIYVPGNFVHDFIIKIRTS